LVNGIIYEDRYIRKVGHQFFLEDQFYNGTLEYRGKIYKGLEMKYDIYDQQLILYVNHNSSTTWFVPSNDFITSYCLGGKFFSKYNFQGEPEFYQVVFDTEKLKCLYYWFKERHDSNKLNYSGYNEFTESKKKNYLMLNGSLRQYKNNSSFTKLFPDEMRDRVKDFIKINHINVDQCSDEKTIELLTYCNSLF